MRGDRPLRDVPKRKPNRFTPHARGSTKKTKKEEAKCLVYPACAGIDPRKEGPGRYVVCLPRMRGDRPPKGFLPSCLSKFTPHARGSTSGLLQVCPIGWVYPACAGIDRNPSFYLSPSLGLPRMRGDRPRRKKKKDAKGKFTPHARGSTHQDFFLAASRTVYPACAGIDRKGHA